jgi:Peptidase family M1 domain
MRFSTRVVLIGLIGLSLGGDQAAAQTLDPKVLQQEIAGLRLDFDSAISLQKLNLNAGLANLHFDDGILGKGRVDVDPPDPIEAGQLELFTGEARLDEEIQAAVLVVGLDAAVDAMLRRPKAGELSAEDRKRAGEIYDRWHKSPERKLLNADSGILSNAIGDPFYEGYFTAWFRGNELGDFLYMLDPTAREQATLGRFVPLDATEKEKRKLLRVLDRQQRQGRLIGVEVEDLGQWDSWLSSSLRGKDGTPAVGRSPFEPERYTLDLRIEGGDLRLQGRARLDLKKHGTAAARILELKLDSDLQVQRVTDAAGAELFFARSGADLTVVLSRAVAAGEPTAVVVEYQGNLLERDGRTVTLRDTLNWYPHAGQIDRALYDVTFHWPKKFELLSCGQKIEGGEAPGGVRWERRKLDRPAFGFTFEIGRYRIEQRQAGHVAITLAFDAEGSQLLEKEVRDQIGEAVADSLQYFEELFGPYPLDQMTVVTVPRYFSQAMPGFVTLSNLMMADLGFFNQFLQFEDRRTVIAHEISHQWWGHQVGWTSYRDQWISEAVANYAALLYSRNRLTGKDGKARVEYGPTHGWQDSLTQETADGHSLESLGPIVLGERLLSSKASDAYQPIVYNKGAVILDMLARAVGQDAFPKVLREIQRVAAGQAISTEDFLQMLEKSTASDLGWFSKRYVYGTGLPEIYYSYRVEPQGTGKWSVLGEARQRTPYRFRYRVVKTASGAFDVARERMDQIAVEESALVVPFEAEIFDPARPPVKGKKKGQDPNATARGHMLIRGEITAIQVDLDYEPKTFYLDRNAAVFGRFFNESHRPKKVLFYQGLDSAAAGRADEAEALFLRALASEVAPLVDPKNQFEKEALRREGRSVDGQIELSRARLFLDREKDAEAQAALDRGTRLLGPSSGWVREEVRALESRLDLRRGQAERVFKRLRKGLLQNEDIDSTESFVLLAIAAQATGNRNELQRAVKTAKENGADLTLLPAL